MILNKIPENIQGELFQVNNDGSRSYLETTKLKEYLMKYPTYYLTEESEVDSSNNIQQYYCFTSNEKIKILKVYRQLLHEDWFN